MDRGPIHSSLDPNRPQIRLLTLHSASHEDEPVYCTLQTCFVGEAPPYEALSYVWGDATVSSPIYVGPLLQRFDATTNLKSALSHLRYRDRDRILWADAICIDQVDDDEKSQQVRMMRKIYEGADSVLAWLGPETPGAEEAIRTLESLAADEKLHWAEKHMRTSESSVGRDEAIRLHNWFGESKWWTRIWTVQEYASAKKLVFVCGKFSIMRSTVEKLAQHFFRHFDRCCPLLEHDGDDRSWEASTRVLNDILNIESIKAGGLSNLSYDLLVTFRLREATRPEDKVFGLVGLVKNVDEKMIAYGKTASYIYEDLTRVMIKASNNLDVLTHAATQTSKPASSLDEAISVPSWVPNWAARLSPELTRCLGRRQVALRLYKTSGLEYPEAAPSDSGKLVVKCVLWDRIASTGDIINDEPRNSNALIFNDWYQMATHGLPSEAYVGGGTTENAFWRTLCIDITSFIEYSPNDPRRLQVRATDMTRSGYDAWWQLVQNICSHGLRDHTSPEFTAKQALNISSTEFMVERFFFDGDVITGTCNRRFFISERGYIGVAPSGAALGDSIAVIFGGSVPYIVRPNKSRSSGATWTLIGDSYVHGIMDGEVMKSLHSGECKSEIIVLE